MLLLKQGEKGWRLSLTAFCRRLSLTVAARSTQSGRVRTHMQRVRTHIQRVRTHRQCPRAQYL